MTNLCEIKSVAFYRNSNNFAVYLTAKSVGHTDTFSTKIVLDNIPCCIGDQYLYLKTGSSIGKQKISEKIGQTFQTSEIERYQLFEITNYDKTKTYKDIHKCGSTMEH